LQKSLVRGIYATTKHSHDEPRASKLEKGRVVEKGQALLAPGWTHAVEASGA